MKMRKLLLVLSSAILLSGCNSTTSTSTTSSGGSSTSKSETSTSSSGTSATSETPVKTALETPVLSLDETSEKLTWLAVTNADTYEVFEGDKSLGTTKELFYDKLNVIDVEEHSYHIVAKDSTDAYYDSSSSNVVKFQATATKLAAPSVDDEGKITGVDQDKISSLTLDIQNGARDYVLDKNTSALTPSTYGKVVKYKIKATADTAKPRYLDSDYSETKTYVADIEDSDLKDGKNYELNADKKLPDWYVSDAVKRDDYAEGVGIEYGAAYYQAREISEGSELMTIYVRNFRSEDSRMQVYVNGTVLKDSEDNDVAMISSDAYLSFTYDLSDYIGKKVWVWFVGLTNATTCVNKVIFGTDASLTTADADKFIGSVNGNDGASKAAWTAYQTNPTGAYVYGRGTLDIGNEGLKFHYNNRDTLSVKDVLVDASATKWTIDVRGFGDNKAAYQMEVNETVIIPTIVSGKTTLSDSTINVGDGWSVLCYDLTSYIDEKVTVKLSVVDNNGNNNDTMIGGFYFAA